MATIIIIISILVAISAVTILIGSWCSLRIIKRVVDDMVLSNQSFNEREGRVEQRLQEAKKKFE